MRTTASTAKQRNYQPCEQHYELSLATHTLCRASSSCVNTNHETTTMALLGRLMVSLIPRLLRTRGLLAVEMLPCPSRSAEFSIGCGGFNTNNTSVGPRWSNGGEEEDSSAGTAAAPAVPERPVVAPGRILEVELVRTLLVRLQ